MNKKLFFILFLLIILILSCATTAEDIHRLGKNGNYDRIRYHLKNNPPKSIRIAAAIELGKGDYVFAIDDLIHLSKNADPDVRNAAVTALGSYAGNKVYRAIIRRTSDSSRTVVQTAGEILKTWGHESMFVLLETLDDQNHIVRASSADILGQMNDHRIGPALLETLCSEQNAFVKEHIIRALTSVRYAPAKKKIYELSQRAPTKNVSIAAEEALRSLGGTVTNIVISVFPTSADNTLPDELATFASTTLVQLMVSRKIATVITPKVSDFSIDDIHSLQQNARTQNTDQFIVGTLSGSNEKITFIITRYDTETAAVLQRDSAEGYRYNARRIIQKTADLFIRRFQ